MNQEKIESNLILQDVQKILHFLNNFKIFNHSNDSKEVSASVDAITFRFKDKDLSQSKNIKKQKNIFSNIVDFINIGIEAVSLVRKELKNISLENAIDNLNEFYSAMTNMSKSNKIELEKLGNSSLDYMKKQLLLKRQESINNYCIIDDMKNNDIIKKDLEYINLFNEFQILKEEYGNKYLEFQIILDEKIIPFFEKFVYYFNDSIFEQSTLDLVLKIKKRLNDKAYVVENISSSFDEYDNKLPQKKDLIELLTKIKNQMNFFKKCIECKLDHFDFNDILELNDLDNYLIERKSFIFKTLGLKKSVDLIKVNDTDFNILKLELKNLENLFQELIEEKLEYLNDIEEFNTLYNLHLGELLKDILNLKKEILYKQTIKQQEKRKTYEDDIEVFNSTKENIEDIKQTIKEFEKVLENIDKDDENYDEIFATYKELQEELEKLEIELDEQEENLSKTKEEIDNNEVFEEYQDIKKQYEQFYYNYEDIKQQQSDVYDITNEQKSELKKIWKKACKLCHPDIVIDKFKEKAHAIMQALNDAYSKKDIVKVQEILSNLENGLTFEIESDNINDKEILKSKINQIKKNILVLEKEIEDLKHDETYQIIQEIDDINEYFEELKSELQSEKDRLEKEAKGILQKSDDEIPEWIQKLWDWADRNNISSGKLSRQIENLINTSTIDFTNLKLENIPSEIINLKKLTTLVLWDCNLRYLPKDIIKLKWLKKLNIRGNSNLSLTQSQKDWIDELRKKAIVFSDDNYTIVIDSTLDFVENSNINNSTFAHKKSLISYM